MYQPKYKPQLENALRAIPEMSYGIIRSDDYVDKDAPDIDPLHLHGYLEIFFNIDSDVSFLVNDRLYPVARGEAIVTRPNDIHMCIYHSLRVHDHICLWIDSDLTDPLFSYLHTSSFCPLFSFKQAESERIAEHLDALLASNGNGAELAEVLHILEILSVLREMTTDTPREEKRTLPSALQAVVDDIHRNFAEIKTVSELARAHYISTSTLARWFGTHLHISPREYLESRKLAYALTRLREGRTVTDACADAGFSDCSYFIARFKRKFGETPMQYRRNREEK